MNVVQVHLKRAEEGPLLITLGISSRLFEHPMSIQDKPFLFNYEWYLISTENA